MAEPAASGNTTPVSPAQGIAQEARNNFLIRQAGYLRRDGYDAREICAMLASLNATRYGEGRHPQGPLDPDELQRTIFKSVAEWERLNGVLAAPQMPEIHWLVDLVTMDLPPVNWVVPDLLAEGVTLLAGKPKVGKSWLILGLALACSLGSDAGGLVLGRYPVKPMGVLYLTLEDNAARLRSRMLKILGQQRVPPHFGYALRWKSLGAGGLHDLDSYLLTAPDTRLVIIDTLAKVRQQSGNSNSIYQEESDLMTELQVLACTHHLAVVVVHHLRKMGSDDVFDEVSGTLGLTGGADSTIVLKRARYEQTGTLAITGRDVEEQELAATFHKESGLWVVTNKVEEEQPRGRSDIRQTILDLLREKGEMTPAEIATALEKPGSSVRATLARMNKGGFLRKKSHGSYELGEKGRAKAEQEDLFEEETDD